MHGATIKKSNIKFHEVKVYGVCIAELSDITSHRRNIKRIYIYIIITDKKDTVLYF